MAGVVLDRVHTFNPSSTKRRDYIIPSAAIIQNKKVYPSIQVSWTCFPRLQCWGSDIMHCIQLLKRVFLEIRSKGGKGGVSWCILCVRVEAGLNKFSACKPKERLQLCN